MDGTTHFFSLSCSLTTQHVKSYILHIRRLADQSILSCIQRTYTLTLYIPLVTHPSRLCRDWVSTFFWRIKRSTPNDERWEGVAWSILLLLLPRRRSVWHPLFKKLFFYSFTLVYIKRDPSKTWCIHTCNWVVCTPCHQFDHQCQLSWKQRSS